MQITQIKISAQCIYVNITYEIVKHDAFLKDTKRLNIY